MFAMLDANWVSTACGEYGQVPPHFAEDKKMAKQKWFLAKHRGWIKKGIDKLLEMTWKSLIAYLRL